MKEPDESQQAAITRLTEVIGQQTVAITRLAESNESLVAVILQLIDDRIDDDDESSSETYLSGKSKGG